MNKILYHSTNGYAEKVDFKGALLKGQAPDKGLYMPEIIPSIPIAKILQFSEMSYPQIAYEVISPYTANLVPDGELRSMLRDVYNFDVPVEEVYDGKYILRLDRGPTCSFKDFAARLMGKLIQYFLLLEDKSITILTATSGDTGSAVAHAFYGLDNINVVILFPENEVTDRQRRQMTTLGGNVHVLAVDGKFDDCQALVKAAFADPDLESLNLSSANSINVGRLLPQAVYYFYACSRVATEGDAAVISVPSGNFGDLMGGLIAMKMGLPVHRFIAATNENDEFPKFMRTGIYEPIRPSKNCISNAMNVGHPSNLARVFALYEGQMDETGRVGKQPDINAMRKDIFAISISDEETRRTIREAYLQYRVLLEPHGAVGWSGLMKYLDEFGDWSPCISLETADPAKFPDEIIKLTGMNPPMSKAILKLEDLDEHCQEISMDYESLKAYLKKRSPEEMR